MNHSESGSPITGEQVSAAILPAAVSTAVRTPRAARSAATRGRWAVRAGVALSAVVVLLASTGVGAQADDGNGQGTHVSTINVSCVNDPVADTAALVNAISTAGARNGTVSIAAGTCALNNNLPVRNAETIKGAGATATFLVQHAYTNIFQITGAGVTVTAMNLDTATYNASAPVAKNPNPAVLYSNANNTTVSNLNGEAGSGFGMRFTGPNPCSNYPRSGQNISNVNMTTTGTGGFAAIDVDCQNGSSVSNVTIHGGMLALFQDTNVTVVGENFTPGPLAKNCAPPWGITGPTSNISVDQVTSAGGTGIYRNVTLPGVGLSITNQAITNPGC